MDDEATDESTKRDSEIRRSGAGTPDGAEAEVERLVHGFAERLAALGRDAITEASLRLEYLDPFWTALGWDVANARQRPPAVKDVVVEPPVATADGATPRQRRPDYVFRIDGFPRFVVEAKRPSVDVGADRDAVFQAKTYAWSAQIPFAVLTNFDRFRLFDCTVKPYHAEPERGLVAEFDLSFSDYVARWAVLADTFGREAAGDGSLERLLVRLKGLRKGRRLPSPDRALLDVRGTEPVSDAFLAHLQEFRGHFAAAVYRDNRSSFPDAETRSGAARITEAVQRILDRIVFLRACEDRGIVEWGMLRARLADSADGREDLYRSLTGLFRTLDHQFNGYLFKPHFCDELEVSADLLASFVRSLYAPESPFRFDAFAEDLLGRVYENFLSSVLEVRSGQVRFEPKPEVRHAGGVYYTPPHVVDMIVRLVVDPRLRGRTPQEVMRLRIVDPACGSGSFLFAAFQRLIDYCTAYVTDHPECAARPKGRRSPAIAFRDPRGDWHLSPEFRAGLLTSCIYGVDIDPEAVEVTIMNLYLKMLEGRLPPHWQRDWLESRLLPPLDGNVRCGNSLLEMSEFERWYETSRESLFEGDADTRRRLNPFDWSSRTRGFGNVVETDGGFDCVIGNPPYIRVQELRRWAPLESEFYRRRYASAGFGGFDVYLAFIERGMDLLGKGGRLGFICPNKFWHSDYGRPLRDRLAKGRSIRRIVDFGDQQVFDGVTSYTAVQILAKEPNRDGIDYARFDDLSDGPRQCAALLGRGTPPGVVRRNVPHPDSDGPWFFRSAGAESFLAKLGEGAETLCPDVCSNLFQGIVTGADDVFLFASPPSSPRRDGTALVRSEAASEEVELEEELLAPVVRSRGFQAFYNAPTHRLLLPYDRDSEKLFTAAAMKARFPRAWDYLNRFKGRLQSREAGKFRDRWWSLSRSQNVRRWNAPKLQVPYLLTGAAAAWDDEGAFFVNVTTGGYGLELKPGRPANWRWVLLGLLNSAPLGEALRLGSGQFRGGYFPANKQFLRELPIRAPSSAAGRRKLDRIAEIAEALWTNSRRLRRAVLSDHERELLGREIDAHRALLDAKVCDLYGIDEVPASM